MDEIKVLFVNQEIEPYVVGTQMASAGLKLPQQAMALGYDVRTFMPKFGVINERRNQLHEVIRLSGLNLVIAGADHPLIIKVASLQSIRLQVYFIDNEDYFLRRGIFHDELGMPYSDNDERGFFFAKGVLETVKKLRWIPDIIHCNGWFTSFIPPLVRTLYGGESLFGGVKILYTLYDDTPDEPIGANPYNTVGALKITPEEREGMRDADHAALCRLAIRYSDAVGKGEIGLDPGLIAYTKELERPLYDLHSDEQVQAAYKSLMGQ